jgi:hypothetical protein
MKNLFLVAACALAFGAFHPSSARADDPAAAEKKDTIKWVEGWSAGREAAKKSGKLMFVYVHRTNPG